MMMTDVKRAGPIRTAGVLAAVLLLAFAACQAPAPTATQSSSDTEAAAVQATGSSEQTANSVTIRGTRADLDLGKQQPLVYVDGIRVDNSFGLEGGPGGGVLDDIDPSDIESIEIFKGPATEALYGSEAAGGVIQIVTKAYAAVGASR